MKVLLLSDANSVHTIRWVNSISKLGVNIILFSFYPPTRIQNYTSNNIIIESYFKENRNISVIDKLLYLLSIMKVRNLVEKYKPNIIHAHYATSYGFILSLLSFKPKILSVWGSDIFLFPLKSIIHKILLKNNLRRADYLLSTSYIMAIEAAKYTSKKIMITPFGVDAEKFKKVTGDSQSETSSFVFGTIKSLKLVYGIDIAIRAFSLLVAKYPTSNLEFHIAGIGSELNNLKALCEELEIENRINFLNFIEEKDIPKVLNTFDVFVALSRSESFGVAAIEAMSCELPVLVSNAPGLQEIVENNVNGLVVPIGEVESSFLAMEKLFLNEELRILLSTNARKRVMECYDWNENVQAMLKIYHEVANKNS